MTQTSTSYRAAYINDCVLTLPEHSHLDDASLTEEAWLEAQRARITVGDNAIAKDQIEIGMWNPN
jgi:hypothetical protein